MNAVLSQFFRVCGQRFDEALPQLGTAQLSRNQNELIIRVRRRGHLAGLCSLRPRLAKHVALAGLQAELGGAAAGRMAGHAGHLRIGVLLAEHFARTTLHTETALAAVGHHFTFGHHSLLR